jgi:ribonuclease HI
MKNEKGTIEIYTDGSAKAYTKKTKGYGGWAYVHVFKPAGGSFASLINNPVRQDAGPVEKTTNNKMELTAILKGLLALTPEQKADNKIIVYSDSAYSVNAFRENWIEKWENNYWQTKTGRVKNKELWVPLVFIVREIPDIEFIHVKGHNGNQYNELADTLAQGVAEKLRQEKDPNFLEARRIRKRNYMRKPSLLINKRMYRQPD